MNTSRCTASSFRGCYSRRESELAVVKDVNVVNVVSVKTAGVSPWVLRASAPPTGVVARAALRMKPGRGWWEGGRGGKLRVHSHMIQSHSAGRRRRRPAE